MDNKPDLSISDAIERADAAEAQLFLDAHPEYYANKANGERLMQRAIEICGNSHPFLMDYEAAYRELSAEGGLEQRPAPEPEPKPVRKMKTDDRGIIRVGSDGGTRVLQVDPAVRAELNKLPIRELARRAAVDRFNNLSTVRKRQIKADEI